MVNTINELRSIFDNGDISHLRDDNYVNSQNVCRYHSGDNSLFYGEMNSDEKMFDLETYKNRIRNIYNIRSSCFRDVFGDRMWNKLADVRKSSFYIDGVICEYDLSCVMVEHLVWNPMLNMVKPVIVIPSEYKRFGNSDVIASMYPEMAYHTYHVVKHIAGNNGLVCDYPYLAIFDYDGRFIIYDMQIYIKNERGWVDSVNNAIHRVTSTVMRKLSFSNGVEEGEICMLR